MESISERRNRTRKLNNPIGNSKPDTGRNIVWFEHVATTEGSTIRVHDNRFTPGIPAMVTDFKMPMNHIYVYDLAKEIVEKLNKEVKS